MGVDRKPRRRIVLSPADWRPLRFRLLHGSVCRICGGPGESLHHLVAKSARGDDVEENLVQLCGDGVQGCHGKIEAMDLDARIALRAALTDAEVEYAVARKGQAWLDQRYPPRRPDPVPSAA